jgi:hypothetical protein
MNTGTNVQKYAAFRILLILLIVSQLFVSAAAAESEIFPYQSTTLTLEPAKDRLSIRLTPQLLGLWETYYYTPDDAAQKELRALLDELKLLNYTIDEKFWKDHPESGYTIVDDTNRTEWMMLSGNHLLYTKFESGEGIAFMHRRYAQCDALTAYLEPILAGLMQYTAFDASSLTGLSAATLTLSDGQTETVTDPAVLKQIEDWFSKAVNMRAPSCPNGNGMLTLTTASGASVQLLLTVDECPYFSVNGIYFDYTPTEIRKDLAPNTIYPNSFLFGCFPGITFVPIDLHP